MGTLKTVIDNARIKIRDTDKILFTSDTELITIVNTILEGIYQTLVFIESNLVYDTGTITTTADTQEYTPSFTTKGGFMPEGSWIEDEDTYLFQVSEAEKILYGDTTSKPEGFYVTEDGKIGYVSIPDDTYTIYHQYWKPFTELTDYDNDDLPWENIWNKAVERQLIVELLEIAERDNSRQAIMAQREFNKALNLTYSRGIRRRTAASDMFTIDGI